MTAAFAELVAATNYSFLRGASHPSDMVAAALAAGHAGLGIADRNTVAGVVRAYVALRDAQAKAENEGLPPFDFKLIVGARLVFADGTPDIVAYPTTRFGWGRLTRLLTVGNLEAKKGDCVLRLADLLDHIEDLLLIVMPGEVVRVEESYEPAPSSGLRLVVDNSTPSRHPSEGWDPSKLSIQNGPGRDPSLQPLAEVYPERLPCRQSKGWGDCSLKRVLATLTAAAPDRVWLGATIPRAGRDRRRLAKLVRIAKTANVPLLATNDALYATPEQRPLHDIVTCIRAGTTIAEAGRRLEANAERHVKSAAEMTRLFKDHPQAIHETPAFLDRIGFSLDQLRYEYPHEPVPEGWDPQDWLEHLVLEAARKRYDGPPPTKMRALLDEEFELIGRRKYAYYFLTVHDVVAYARNLDPPILCQGRGSAANSAVCFLLGITSIDPSEHNLLFSRFISDNRNEPPDIDVDFEHERREEVMQYIYRRYGRHRAAIAATVIHYRPRSAVREVGKVLGLSEDITARISSTVWGSYASGMEEKRYQESGFAVDNPDMMRLGRFVEELLEFPRHLSQHVGGFVLTEDRLDETVPIHNAAMEDRTFIEWDKDDIDALGLMKVDILALGMLTCIRKAFNLIEGHLDTAYLLDTIPHEHENVYKMLQRGDSIGVFQVESRAQINMLPRLKPVEFYDLVVQVAIVRPGPIQGNMVHPYLRRRQGIEKPEYPSPAPPHHPDELRHVLGKTLGVPLFQEQAMRLAITAAAFEPWEADQFRRAMATFRNVGTMPEFEEKMVGGMTRRGYDPDFAQRCFNQIKGFGSYGFPESHALSFGLLVYVSSYIKCCYPAVFACALLNSQPMGFYAPAQIVRDAREHGVVVLPIDINASDWDNGLEIVPLDAPPASIAPQFRLREGSGWDERSRQDTTLALRIGFCQVDGFREEWGNKIMEVRAAGPFLNIETLARRAELPRRALRLLADADAFRSIGLDRRQALWEVRRTPDGELPLFAAAKARELGKEPDAALPDMPMSEHVAADYQMTRLSLKDHPMTFLRPVFEREGVLSCKGLAEARNGTQVRVAGIVLVRQRPGEGKAIFITLEDETGITNVLLWARIFESQRREVMASRLMVVEGEVQKSPEGVVHLMGVRVHDRTAELDRLSEDHQPTIMLMPADKALQPDPRSPRAQRAGHPRNVRILPKSRDFH